MQSFAKLKSSLPPGVVATSSMALAEASRPTRFWNLTRHTISEFPWHQPAPPTSVDNQCKNDKDGTVDSDERLRITGVAPGIYDAKLKDVSGRSCLVRNIKVKAGEIFSIEEKDLTSCTRQMRPWASSASVVRPRSRRTETEISRPSSHAPRLVILGSSHATSGY